MARAKRRKAHKEGETPQGGGAVGINSPPGKIYGPNQYWTERVDSMEGSDIPERNHDFEAVAQDFINKLYGDKGYSRKEVAAIIEWAAYFAVQD